MHRFGIKHWILLNFRHPQVILKRFFPVHFLWESLTQDVFIGLIFNISSSN